MSGMEGVCEAGMLMMLRGKGLNGMQQLAGHWTCRPSLDCPALVTSSSLALPRPVSELAAVQHGVLH